MQRQMAVGKVAMLHARTVVTKRFVPGREGFPTRQKSRARDATSQVDTQKIARQEHRRRFWALVAEGLKQHYK